MNIVFIADGTHILANVVIVDSIHANLVLRVIFSFLGVITMIVAQAKIASYYNRHLEIVKTFRCLQQQTNDFFQRFANMAWSSKRLWRSSSFNYTFIL
jgi:hypothetical protein